MKLTNSRGVSQTAEQYIKESFKELITSEMCIDAIYTESSCKYASGVAGIPIKAPAMLELLKDNRTSGFLLPRMHGGNCLLIMYEAAGYEVRFFEKKDIVRESALPLDIKEAVRGVLEKVSGWAGTLNSEGGHEIDLRAPSPGPHFFVNLLLGNRTGYPHPLQTTPKSVVDRLGGGSFRSHAATQVLAGRWDMRQEENGFPANRQFYITEGSSKIFYSAAPDDKNIVSAKCIHSQNHTVITYRTVCGIDIKRTIFILPQKAGLPLATEVQRIELFNAGKKSRRLRLVYTGMFGSAAPGALQEDVLYSNIVMQAGVLRGDDGYIMAVTPDYFRDIFSEDRRFHTTLIRKGDDILFPAEFSTNYNEFVGNGTLEEPQGLFMLSNRLYRKGPGFFAVAGEVELEAGKTVLIDNFTGLVSFRADPAAGSLEVEVASLIEHFSKPDAVQSALEENKKFLSNYSSFIRLKSSDRMLDTYFSRNLPFQVLYQTFVSRSFCQTQKGYREIGFREIQDIYASMYYFVSAGMDDLVKQLLKEWCCNVFEFGFAYHNFFWTGKEAGKWSDDAIWFVQAVVRYVRLTGDLMFLDEECEIAGTSPVKKRSVYETIKAIIRYSGEISVGRHGLPLLDYADWNDCLKLDNDCIDGITKEKMYCSQVEKGHYGEPFVSNYSESVMNAFLLKAAVDGAVFIAHKKKDNEYEGILKGLSGKLHDNLQKYAWKGDFFARVLFNRYEDGGFSYLGAKGDGLSSDPSAEGVYFLNSFSWALLSDTASDSQIGCMLDAIEKVLKTPFGLKLMSPAALGRISQNTAAGEYFYGDRENGGIFKHACMMATAAMFKAAKQVRDTGLAQRLAGLAYWIVDLVLPYNCMKDPYLLCGNPRFCTQYNNSETGENIGPMLSGTSTWLTLTLLCAFGVEFTHDGIIIDPVLREDQTEMDMEARMYGSIYNIRIRKPEGFFRFLDKNPLIMLDGEEYAGNVLPVLRDGRDHNICVDFHHDL